MLVELHGVHVYGYVYVLLQGHCFSVDYAYSLLVMHRVVGLVGIVKERVKLVPLSFRSLLQRLRAGSPLRMYG